MVEWLMRHTPGGRYSATWTQTLNMPLAPKSADAFSFFRLSGSQLAGWLWPHCNCFAPIILPSLRS